MRAYRWAVLLAATVLAAQAAAAAQRISYTVSADPTAGRWRVSITVPRIQGGTVDLQMPSWSPGAYIMGNYAQRVQDLAAAAPDGTPLEVTRPDASTWRVAAGRARTVVVRYSLGGAGGGMLGRGGAVSESRAALSGPSSYLYVVGRQREPVDLCVEVPAGWKVAVSLDPGKEPNHYVAPNYDVLADAPIEAGNFAEDTFEVGGVPHRIVLTGSYDHIDRARLVEVCRRVAEAQTRFFRHIPYKRYIFLFNVTGPRGRGGGGLEHLASTQITFSGDVSDSIASLISHEFFHLWNVKRIRPKPLGPFDYTKPAITGNLWWSEGVTSYYGDLLLTRAGLWTKDVYLRHLGSVITNLQGNPARLRVSAEESSRRVWETGGTTGYGGLSYYVKGELMGLCLDLKIRSVTGGRRSLDDVMRSLYDQCGRGEGPGFDEDAIRRTVSRVAGRDLSSYYDLLARSTEELPLAEALAVVGLKLIERPGGRKIADMGLGLRRDRERQGVLLVESVAQGGAAARAGLRAGDTITSINGEPAGFLNMGYLTRPEPGSRIRVRVERSGRTEEMELVPDERDAVQYSVEPDPEASAEALKRQAAWLGAS
jgi:predicted metalloprotease with PDZ domain